MDRVLAATLKKLTRAVRARLKGLIEGRLGVEVFLQAVGWPFEIHASRDDGGGRVCRVRRKRRFESKAGIFFDFWEEGPMINASAFGKI